MSNIDQSLSFIIGDKADQDVVAGSDDGHSFFIDDIYQVGAGFNIPISSSLNMVANQIYKITAIANNSEQYGPSILSINSHVFENSAWNEIGHLSDIANVSMNATGNFNAAPVPEPATILLLGTGLAGLITFKKCKKG